MKKIKPFSHSTGYSIREESTKVEAPLSPSSTVCALITGDRHLSLAISKDETKKKLETSFQRKNKVLLTEDEIRSFTQLLHYIESFLQCRKQNVKTSTQSLSYEALADVQAPGWWINRQKRSFTAKRDSTLGEGRKSAQFFIMTKLRDSLSALSFIWETF